MKRFLTLALLACAAVLLTPAAYAQQQPFCSTALEAGVYTFTCNGWVYDVPVRAEGLATLGTRGSYSGPAFFNIGGLFSSATGVLTGATVFNSDCTGGVTINLGTKLSIDLALVANPVAHEIYGVTTTSRVLDTTIRPAVTPSTVNGTVISCTFKSMAAGPSYQ